MKGGSVADNELCFSVLFLLFNCRQQVHEFLIIIEENDSESFVGDKLFSSKAACAARSLISLSERGVTVACTLFSFPQLSIVAGE